MPKGTNQDAFGDMLDELKAVINWKIAIRDTDVTIYRQVDRKYFERIAKPLCKMEVRGHFQKVTSSLVSGMCDALIEDKERLFDDELFLESRKRIVGFRNKVFDLLTGCVRSYQPSDYVLDPIPYDIPENIDSNVQTWIEGVFNQWVGSDVGGWFMDLLSYLLFIYPNTQDLWVNLFGVGSNGKSSCLRLIEGIVGDDKVNGCELKHIGRFSGDAFRNRWLIVGRDSGNVVSDQATSFIKAFTGERKLHIEKKGGAEYDAPNTGKLIVSTNYLIQSKDRSYGWYRRLVPIPFMTKFKIDPTFEDRLLKKIPDIARVLLHRAYLLKHNQTLLMKCAPKPVKNLRNETRMLNDRIAGFWLLYCHDEIEEIREDENGYEITETRFELNPDNLLRLHNQKMSEVYEVYKAWHEEEFGETQVEPSLKTFGGPRGAFLQSEFGDYFDYKKAGDGRKVILRNDKVELIYKLVEARKEAQKPEVVF